MGNREMEGDEIPCAPVVLVTVSDQNEDMSVVLTIETRLTRAQAENIAPNISTVLEAMKEAFYGKS